MVLRIFDCDLCMNAMLDLLAHHLCLINEVC